MQQLSKRTHFWSIVPLALLIGLFFLSSCRSDSPPPAVLFTDFASDALVFELHFWTRPGNVLDRLEFESALRFRIDDVFREADITIAFPQRDVHLDSIKPVEVRVLKD